MYAHTYNFLIFCHTILFLIIYVQNTYTIDFFFSNLDTSFLTHKISKRMRLNFGEIRSDSDHIFLYCTTLSIVINQRCFRISLNTYIFHC